MFCSLVRKLDRESDSKTDRQTVRQIDRGTKDRQMENNLQQQIYLTDYKGYIYRILKFIYEKQRIYRFRTDGGTCSMDTYKWLEFLRVKT